jgi:putative ABC transport system permease protein
VTLTGLAARNAFLRNKTRSLLTIAGVVITALAFVFLRSVLNAWYASSESSAADRVVTRNAVSIIQPLPLNYRDRIAQVPGVTAVTYQNWFGGYYKERRNFFANFAVEPKTTLDIFDVRFLAGSAQDFLSDRNSCLVGKDLAKRFGFRIGDTVPLISEIYPGDWRFRVAGIIDSPEDETVQTGMYFHWARLNEGLPQGRKDQVGVFISKIARANESPRVTHDIDALFANSEAETHTETEKAFRLQFVTGSSAILNALQVVSGVILIIMALILGNTLAMGLRERTSELGAMRAIGFLPRHVSQLAVIEGALLGVTGGILGVALAPGVLGGFRAAMAKFGIAFPIFMHAPTAIAALAAAAVLGAAASLMPAVQAARLRVVDALRRQE